ncbi:MAG TPA: hypothetical protein VE865_15775 [Bradyrhizobium sp.]|nr:hypothetical protein [Bradyrhizobium sp.]
MRRETKPLVLVGLLGCVSATACLAQAYSGFWVVGNHTTNRCEIVTSNPLIDYTVIWFGSGPYRSLDDAMLARSTIGQCPKDEPKSAGSRAPEDSGDGPG